MIAQGVFRITLFDISQTYCTRVDDSVVFGLRKLLLVVLTQYVTYLLSHVVSRQRLMKIAQVANDEGGTVYF